MGAGELVRRTKSECRGDTCMDTGVDSLPDHNGVLIRHVGTRSMETHRTKNVKFTVIIIPPLLTHTS